MKTRTWLILLAAVPVVVAAALIGAWLVDRDAHQGEVARNVVLDGEAVGGLDGAAIEARVAALSERYNGQPAELQSEADQVVASNGDLGFAVDQDATLAAVLAAGRADSLPREFVSWARSFIRPHEVEPTYTFDPEIARETLAAHPATQPTEPVEPDLVYRNKNLRLVRAVPGATFDIEGAVAALQGADPAVPVSVEAAWTEIPTVVSDAEVREAATKVRQATADGLELQIGSQSRWVSPAVARSWVRPRIDDDVTLRVDRDVVDNHLRKIWRGVRIGGTRPELTVSNGAVEVVRRGKVPQVCCARQASRLLSDAVLGRGSATIELPLRASNDPELIATARGQNVKEMVAEFTTNHSCCEARVTNIHRIADLVRGAVIYPREAMSLNQVAGQRTEVNGFVPAGMVFYGRLVEAVGGGVSQFATTLFNAAYLAGLDFLEYQSHSLYFTRYPYGREATLSWPAPDLVVENNTDYPVLVWPSYSDTSITVQLWSTKNVNVVETALQETALRQCTKVERFRTRTFSDGRRERDSVFAVYRPDEGLDCDGKVVEAPPGVEP
jgi:vancomycin resistance protein YoaR